MVSNERLEKVKGEEFMGINCPDIPFSPFCLSHAKLIDLPSQEKQEHKNREVRKKSSGENCTKGLHRREILSKP